MKLTGHTILVTGGSVGIGLMLARALVRRGNRVLICGRRQTRLDEARALEPSLEIMACDVSQPSHRRALVDWVQRVAPDISMLFNNAGVQHRIDMRETSAHRAGEYEEIAINLEAPIHLSGLLIPLLETRSEAAIVNITSGLAFTPLADTPVYCATKAALHSFTLSLRHQLRNTSIKVFETAPPLVQSELHAHQKDGPPNTAGMATDAFVEACLRGIEQAVETNTVGSATDMYCERERAFAALNGN